MVASGWLVVGSVVCCKLVACCLLQVCCLLFVTCSLIVDCSSCCCSSCCCSCSLFLVPCFLVSFLVAVFFPSCSWRSDTRIGSFMVVSVPLSCNFCVIFCV